ncbi:MAG: hypothetical protein Q8853_02605, partial [Candidatus Phytoplasma australasiaticum]|nr:hypothetical protein [Candidatus Phytoplasma australasiaticum]
LIRTVNVLASVLLNLFELDTINRWRWRGPGSILWPNEGEIGDFGHFPWVLAYGFWRHLGFRVKNPKKL